MNGVRTHKTLVMIGTDCTGSCKYNYHNITNTTTHYSGGEQVKYNI